MRYFTISYFYASENNDTGFGHCSCVADGDAYPTMSKLINKIKEKDKLKNVIIISITELSESDYYDYIKTE